MSEVNIFAAALKVCAMSHEEAAEFLGLNKRTIERWCRPNRITVVPRDIWQKLADFWGLQLSRAASGNFRREDFGSEGAYAAALALAMDGGRI